MSKRPDPIADPSRVAALRRAGLLDSPPEEPFDRLTSAASTVMDASVALVSLVADDRQFLKSAVDPAGVFQAEGEQVLAFSFCRFVVASGQPVLISDARQSPEYRDHPAVLNGQVVAYAGFPIIVDGGAAIGTVCVLDNRPREWGQQQIEALSDLAREAAELIRQQAAATDAKARLFAAKAGLPILAEPAREGHATAGVTTLLGRMESSGQRTGASRGVAEAEIELAAAALFYLKQLDAYVLHVDSQVPGSDEEVPKGLRSAAVSAQAALLRAVAAFDGAAEQPSKGHEPQALRHSCAAFLDAEARRMRTSLLFRRGETGLDEFERAVSEASAAEQAMRLALRDYTLSAD